MKIMNNKEMNASTSLVSDVNFRITAEQKLWLESITNNKSKILRALINKEINYSNLNPLEALNASN
jgi:hypothetical protein